MVTVALIAVDVSLFVSVMFDVVGVTRIALLATAVVADAVPDKPILSPRQVRETRALMPERHRQIIFDVPCGCA